MAALAARTEGWAAGLQLAALSLRDQTDVDGFVAAFTGSHRYVLDYLTEEVLERQNAEVRTFLLETSALERLSGSLCDAVTGRSDSQRLLEEVDRAGLFLVQLDDVRGWWRYHHLFADLLRARLRPHPDRLRECTSTRRPGTRTAACPTTPSITPYKGAIGVGGAAHGGSTSTRSLNLRGEQATIQNWLPTLPEEVVRSPPAAAAGASPDGQHERRPRRHGTTAQRGRGSGRSGFTSLSSPPPDGSGSLLVNVPAMIALQRSYAAQLRGQPEATATYAQRALEHLGADELMLSSAVEGFFAVAEWLHGRLAEAEEAFESRIGWWRREGQVTTTAWGLLLPRSAAAVAGSPGRGGPDLRTRLGGLDRAGPA